MPEGDTIHRTAQTLSQVLTGQRLQQVQLAIGSTRPFAPTVVERVEARGKNLLMYFDDGHVLWSHMGMNGSWHVYRAGERWRRSPRYLKALLRTDAWVALCFSPQTLELLGQQDIDRHPLLAALGPDTLDGDFDSAEVIRRMRAHDRLTLGEALMRQDLLAGVGNVYKSEALFLARLSPFARIRELPDDTLDRLVSGASRLMHENMSNTLRTTRPAGAGGRLWVYRRSGEPCFRCGTRIEMRRQGLAARSTYYCPECQQVALGDAEQ